MAHMISVVRDYHPLPAGRYVADGPGNGTTFREEFLIPALKRREHVIVNLNGAPGYPSSFLEEAFGGLVRAGIPKDLIRNYLKVEATDPGFTRYIRKIWSYVDGASPKVEP